MSISLSSLAQKRLSALLATALIMLGACSLGDGSGDGETGGTGGQSRGETHWGTVQGAVQKGPLVLGSSVGISILDAALEPRGMVFNTETTSHLGEFSLPFDIDESVMGPLPIEVESSGFYYNESSGTLSKAALTLRALTELQGGDEQVFVNVLTHLTGQRIKQLVGEDAALEDAGGQAETELRAALGLGPQGFDPQRPATALDLVGEDDQANAYLLLVSAALARVTRGEDAALQELINRARSVFAERGDVPAEERDALIAAERSMNPNRVMELFEQRLAKIGADRTVPDLHTVVDTDGDGVVNAEDNCRYHANPEQMDSNGDGLGDACEMKVRRVVAQRGVRCVLVQGHNEGVYCDQEKEHPFSLSQRPGDAPIMAGRFVDIIMWTGRGSPGVCVADEQGSVHCKRLSAEASAPFEAPGLRGKVVAMVSSRQVSSRHYGFDQAACAIRKDGGVDCVQSNDRSPSITFPLRIGKTPDWIGFQDANVLCMRLRETKKVECYHISGYKKFGTREQYNFPVEWVPKNESFEAIAVSEVGSCGIVDERGTLRCWGREGEGELPHPEVAATAVAMDNGQACILDEGQHARCWLTPKGIDYLQVPELPEPSFLSRDVGLERLFVPRVGQAGGSACAVDTAGGLHCAPTGPAY